MTAIPDALRAHVTSDPWATSLGVEFLEVSEGTCRAALRLQPHMVNFQGAPHGAVIFSLADIAFGAACNSFGVPAVALTMTISYLTAAPPGARLVAEATVTKQSRRAGFYEVAVTTDDPASATLIASVHCVAHRLRA